MTVGDLRKNLAGCGVNIRLNANTPTDWRENIVADYDNSVSFVLDKRFDEKEVRSFVVEDGRVLKINFYI